MTLIDGDKPAYPVPEDANVNDQEGMTIRARFAMAAMQGMLSDRARTEELKAKILSDSPGMKETEVVGLMADIVGCLSCFYADGMIAALNAKPEPRP